MLKRWHTPQISSFAEEARGEESLEDFLEWNDSGMGRPVVGEWLTEPECVELNGIFRDIEERVVLPYCPGEEEGRRSQAVCQLSVTQHGDSSRCISHAALR